MTTDTPPEDPPIPPLVVPTMAGAGMVVAMLAGFPIWVGFLAGFVPTAIIGGWLYVRSEGDNPPAPSSNFEARP